MRFVERPEGLAEACRAVPMQRALAGKADKIRGRAMAIAPVRTGRYKYGAIILGDLNDPTGQRRRRAGGRFERVPETHSGGPGGGGFHIRSGVRDGVAYARIDNDTPYAYYLEFGTRYMRRQRILGRAADALNQ